MIERCERLIVMTEPNPFNPIGWLVILLLGFAFFFLAGVPVSSSVQVMPADPAGHPAIQSVPPVEEARPMLPENAELFGVESVDVLIRESAPPQVSVTVSGYWSNGCTAEPRIDRAIDGDNITITVFRIIPPEVMCTMVMQAAEIQIDITDLLVQDGAIRAGHYTVDVNGVAATARF